MHTTCHPGTDHPARWGDDARHGRRWVVPTLVLVALVGGLVLLAWVGQRRLLYFPSDVVPARSPADVEEVVLMTSDGLDLRAWFVPSDGDGDLAGTTMVLLNGNGGNRVGRLPLARRLSAAGTAVLVVDYRGFGANPGHPSASGLALDSRAAVDWVASRPDLDRDRVVYYGESLGAAVAIELATDHPPAALVLRSPFSSLADVTAVHYPVVPTWFLRDRWPSVERMAAIDVPTLVVAGGSDRTIPVEQSRLIETAAAGPSILVVVDGADHNDPVLLAGDPVLDAVTDFLAHDLPPRHGG